MHESTRSFFFFARFAMKTCENAHISFAMFVSLPVCLTNREPLNGPSLNLILGSFTAMCQHTSISVNI
jgi:hypothetical protein